MNLVSKKQVKSILALAEKATEIILKHYNDSVLVQLKTDNSPVTQADIAVSRLLEKELPSIANHPVLSEENTPEKPLWKDWETYWLIDPIDGTRHFINRTGDFCICIALIHRQQAVFGLIYAPTTNTAWFASPEMGAYKVQNKHIQPLATTKPKADIVTLSSDVLTPKMAQFLSVLAKYSWYQRGSALKYIDIIEGKATLYPKLWDTCEWDSAAGQCLIECTGGGVIRLDNGQPLNYGHQTSLINPHFLAYRQLSPSQIEEFMISYRQLPDKYQQSPAQ